MEGLLIFIAIFVLDAVIKGITKKRKEQQQQLPPRDSSRDEFDDAQESAPQGKPTRSLQDLIRQFEEAQRDASQGTYVPPTPPIEEDEEDDEEEVNLPVVPPARPGHFSFREIAESVIQWEEVCVDYLQQAFGFSMPTAARVLAELQKHKIVGRDMGEGYCDVLIHDKVELVNLFRREQQQIEKNNAADEKRKAAEQARKKEELARQKQEATDAEMERQRRLNELEARAREAREHAGTDLAEMAALASAAGASGTNGAVNSNRRGPLLSTKNIADIRRGFLWAKVIDEPRFKKRWTARAR